MAEITETKCKHPACVCLVADDKTYCSQFCEDAGEEVDISCDCGHPGCALA